MNKRVKLAFSAIFGGAFLIGGMSAFVSALMQQSSKNQLRAELTNEQVYLIGMVAAFHCNVERGFMERDKGRDRLFSLLLESGVDTALLKEPIIQTVGWELSQRLDANCSSSGFDESAEIQRLASAQQR